MKEFDVLYIAIGLRAFRAQMIVVASVGASLCYLLAR